MILLAPTERGCVRLGPPMDPRLVEDVVDAEILGTRGYRRQTCQSSTLKIVLLVLIRHHERSLTYAEIADLAALGDVAARAAVLDLTRQGYIRRERVRRPGQVGQPRSRYVVLGHIITQRAQEARERKGVL